MCSLSDKIKECNTVNYLIGRVIDRFGECKEQASECLIECFGYSVDDVHGNPYDNPIAELYKCVERTPTGERRTLTDTYKTLLQIIIDYDLEYHQR